MRRYFAATIWAKWLSHLIKMQQIIDLYMSYDVPRKKRLRHHLQKRATSKETDVCLPFARFYYLRAAVMRILQQHCDQSAALPFQPQTIKRRVQVRSWVRSLKWQFSVCLVFRSHIRFAKFSCDSPKRYTMLEQTVNKGSWMQVLSYGRSGTHNLHFKARTTAIWNHPIVQFKICLLRETFLK